MLLPLEFVFGDMEYQQTANLLRKTVCPTPLELRSKSEFLGRRSLNAWFYRIGGFSNSYRLSPTEAGGEILTLT